ncbi:TonB-dependent receptor plug domain-containing protein, partial [Klebsiella pneumoniae]|uniref:TonB-dependent receptor plug domain-containing protein n=1 Tax=Klebsiella pneumoniae TaxID=573 RepID=UPI002731D31D
TLCDVLSTVPGITFGAGEGGSGYGDSINLRGFSASGDIYVDGVRDSAQYSRTDPFNLEQVEVVSGASSVYSGSGAVGGTINLVSKTPELRDKTTLSAGIGTDSYKRITLDSNQQLNDTRYLQ